MIRSLKDYESLERLNAIFGGFNNLPLILTDNDEISVEELWNKDACPFWVKEGMRKLNLKSTQRVFFKIEGSQWAFSLRKG